jgi:hypothetical protein
MKNLLARLRALEMECPHSEDGPWEVVVRRPILSVRLEGIRHLRTVISRYLNGQLVARQVEDGEAPHE